MALSKAERVFHRKVAACCFNAAWTYLEQRKRGTEDAQRMLDLAHAARYHWGLVGTPENVAVSDWQVSRVYAALDEPKLALAFANSCLRRCRLHRRFRYLSTAYEAVARALATGGDLPGARRSIEKARKALDAAPVDRETRQVFLDQIFETERMIRA
jgi:hypothetical protein